MQTNMILLDKGTDIGRCSYIHVATLSRFGRHIAILIQGPYT